MCSRGALGIVHCALGTVVFTVHLQGGTGHCAGWHGGSTLLNLRENPSCKLLCQPSRINLVFLILPVLPVLLSAHVVFVNIFIVDVVVVYSQACELCFQKAFMAKLIYNISWISSATNAKRNLFSTRGRILCVRGVRYDPNSILDLFWPEVSSSEVSSTEVSSTSTSTEVSSSLFSSIETLLAEPRYRPD